MNADEINEHLSKSVYVGFFDLIGLMLADGIYNPDSSVLNHNSFCFDSSIYDLSYGLAYGNPGETLRTNSKRVFRIDEDIYYTVNKRLYKSIHEAQDVYEHLMPNEMMNSDMVKVFNVLFDELTVKWNKFRLYKSFLSITHENIGYISSYEIRNIVDKNAGGLVFECSPNIKNTNLISQVLNSPFWSYITKYKLSTRSPF